ncbi:hypothetical protein RS9916_40141 [Synechococcus sp. RS9916]|nr:hypothetical protein RS9916_40141 [Synechococcus sp. RS9916]
MTTIKSLQRVLLEVKSADQECFLTISIDKTLTSWFDRSIISVGFVLDLVMALVKADEVAVSNGLPTFFVKACSGKP